MRKALTLAILLPALSLSFAGKKDKKKKKKGGDDTPKVGWVVVDAEKGASCYYAPDFAASAGGARGLVRNEAMNAILEQWRGDRGDGVAFEPKVYSTVETVLLGDPKDVEAIAGENTQWCEKVMAGKASVDEWQGWAKTLKARLTAGECKGSLLPRTMYDYLDITNGWQMPAPFCKGEEVVIEVSEKDYYRLTKDGPWINGDGDKSASSKGLPCTRDDCYPGQVIMMFKSDEGAEIIEPVGTLKLFKVPDHGIIRVMINENDYNENEWKVESGMQHHAGVTYRPK